MLTEDDVVVGQADHVAQRVAVAKQDDVPAVGR